MQFSIMAEQQILPYSLSPPYSLSDNLAPLISRVLISQRLIFCSLTSLKCCNSPLKCTPVKYKTRQKARLPIFTQTTSYTKYSKNILGQNAIVAKKQISCSQIESSRMPNEAILQLTSTNSLYSPSYNLTPPIFRVLIGQRLIFFLYLNECL